MQYGHGGARIVNVLGAMEAGQEGVSQPIPSDATPVPGSLWHEDLRDWPIRTVHFPTVVPYAICPFDIAGTTRVRRAGRCQGRGAHMFLPICVLRRQRAGAARRLAQGTLHECLGKRYALTGSTAHHLSALIPAASRGTASRLFQFCFCFSLVLPFRESALREQGSNSPSPDLDVLIPVV